MTFFLPQGRALQGEEVRKFVLVWVSREVWMVVRS